MDLFCIVSVWIRNIGTTLNKQSVYLICLIKLINKQYFDASVNNTTF